MAKQYEEVAIDAFTIFGPGCCPVCHGPLAVADSEITIMDVDKNGNPISDETFVRCLGKCKKCGHEQEMMRWQGQYLPYSESNRYYLMLVLREEVKERLERIKDNPVAE